MTAAFSRGCAGCGRNVPLDEWQEGPLGCDACRTLARQAANDVARINSARAPYRQFPGAARG